MEIWKPAFGFPAYLASSHGRVMRATAATGTRPGKILSPTLSRGYATLRLRIDGGYRSVTVHRLILRSFTDKHGAEVNHKNGIRHDNRLDNLEWCTPAENLLHACRVLGKRRGEAHWISKLTESDVVAIHKAFSGGASVMDIARMYPSVSHATISRVLSRKIWRHVDLPT